MITLRRARPDEAAILTDLSMRSKQSNGYDDTFMSACAQELTVTPQRLAEGEYWVADNDGTICGCACLTADQDNKVGEVHAFFIDPGFQRRGVGRQLWEKIAARARDQDLARLHLDADPFAVPFYEAMGFTVVSQAPSGSIEGRMLPKMKALLK